MAKAKIKLYLFTSKRKKYVNELRGLVHGHLTELDRAMHEDRLIRGEVEQGYEDHLKSKAVAESTEESGEFAVLHTEVTSGAWWIPLTVYGVDVILKGTENRLKLAENHIRGYPDCTLSFKRNLTKAVVSFDLILNEGGALGLLVAVGEIAPNTTINVRIDGIHPIHSKAKDIRSYDDGDITSAKQLLSQDFENSDISGSISGPVEEVFFVKDLLERNPLITPNSRKSVTVTF